MKNFSIAALLLAFSAVLSPSLHAAPATPKKQPAKCAFLPNAPDRHVVVRGDTLWDISSRFLQKPWCWPHVWDMNKKQIRDPHWIYPGQIVYFDRTAGRLRLGKNVDGKGAGTSNVRLSPRIRSEELEQDAIASISLSQIGPFLKQPLIIDAEELKYVPRIIATREDRGLLGNGDLAYVRGKLKNVEEFHVFRPGIPLKDPETGKVIGYEAAFLGTMQLSRMGLAEDEAHSFVITQVKEEISIGDRLLPIEPVPFINYIPHPPNDEVEARIVSVYDGVTHAGQNQIVAINRGNKDGIDAGTVLQLERPGRTITDTSDACRIVTAKSSSSDSDYPELPDTTNLCQQIKLPSESYGTLFIFRVFNNISYGLVMQVNNAVQIGDLAKTPD